jgi:hypothetical protein
MEPRFGHDFSRVRIHTDQAAAASARAAEAQAFTIGQEIVFGAGQYAPATPAGRELLAHELAHTIQQGPTARPASPLVIEPARSPAERAADNAARLVTAGQEGYPIPSMASLSSPAGMLLQRRTVTQSYATAGLETGPVWNVTLTITNAPETSGEDLDDFTNACMDGIRNAAESLGSGSEALSRDIRVRLSYQPGFDYATVSQQAFAAARSSVLPAQPRTEVQAQAATPQPVAPQPAAPQQPAQPAPMTVVVVGSPSPEQAYGLQFVSAAICHGTAPNVMWLVEHSGYEMIYGTNPHAVTDSAPAGGLGWITPSHGLVDWINSMPDRSVAHLVVYSHGLPYNVVLRYGWGDVGLPDYGLNLADVARISPNKFTPDAVIEFNSCSTGIGGSASLAQSFANRVGRPVQAWTGRTSYSGVNRGTCRVEGSSYSLSTDAIIEFYRRQQAGTAPQFRTFNPVPARTP